MASESIGSCAGSPPKLPDPRSHFREEKKISPNTPDRRGCRKNDICYHCKQEGHWAMDCPNKAFPKCPQKYPERPCRICCQPCIVRTSRSDKNPGRDFYTCARGSACNMFQWCDELGKSRFRGLNSPVKSVQQCSAAVLQNPECTCTAGPCRVETERNGRQYFVCHLKSGQGPCVHSKWGDGLGDDVLNHNLMTEELKNTGTNNHQEIKEKEKDGEIVVPPPPPPPPPPPLAVLEADPVGAGSSPGKRLNFMEGSPSKRKCIEDLTSTGSSPVKRINFMEGSPSKRKCIEEWTSEHVASPSLNWYLNEEPKNLETNKGADGNRDDADSSPMPPPTGNNAWPECFPMKRLSLSES